MARSNLVTPTSNPPIETDEDTGPDLRSLLLETLHGYVADAGCTMQSAITYAVEDLRAIAMETGVDLEAAYEDAE